MDYLTKTAAGWWRDFLIAAMFFTRLPLPSAHIGTEAPPSLGAAARAFPLVGLLIGVLGALALMIASKFGWHPVVAVLIALGAVALITGALHEDGLADVADGFGGGRDREAKLAIMRDSRIGSFGVMALIFSVGIRAGTLASFLSPGAAALALIAAHVLSRATLPAAMLWLAPARDNGLGAGAGRPDPDGALTGGILAVAVAFLTIGFGAGIAAAVAAAAAALIVGLIAQRQIGGQTGDVLGATQQAAETAAILGAAWVLG